MHKYIFLLFLFLLLLLSRGSAQKKEKFYSGGSDGYSLSEVNFVYSKLAGKTEVCVGDGVTYSVFVTGTSVYTYQWKQIKGGVITNVGRDSFEYEIPKTTLASAARYYCEVTDLRSGDKRYTDTVELKVYTYPTLSVGASLTKVIEGTEVVLTASGALNYEWNTGERGSSVTVKPLLTTTYRVKGYDKSLCSRDTFLTIEVLKADLEIGPDRYIVAGESLDLLARLSLSEVRWYRVEQKVQSSGEVTESREFLKAGKELTVSPSAETIYEAEASFTGQTIRRRLTVYVKGGRSFVSGRNDGFTLGEVNFVVTKINGPRELCVGDDALFLTSVTGPSVYHKQWKKLSGSAVTNLGDDTTALFLEHIDVSASARYFCEITDLRSGDKRYTDTVELKVYTYPTLSVGASLTKVIEGTEVVLSASGALNYEWNTGERGSSVTVKPLLTTTYRVKGYDKSLCSRDTFLTIEVLKADLEIGPDRYIVGGESLDLLARSSLDTVRWYRIDRAVQSNGEVTESRVFLKDGKELRVSPSAETVYEAEASFTGQTIRRRLTVYVKGGRSFVSGRNDGFTLGEVNFVVTKINGPRELCMGDNALFLTSVTGPSVYHKQWKRLSGSAVTNLGSDTTALLLEHIDVSASARYFCEITDLRSGDKRYTDTVELKVYTYPTLSVGASLTKVIEGTEVILTASGALNYEWNTGERGSSVTVKPLLTTTYRVKGYDKSLCSRDTFLTIEVLKADLEVGPDRYIVPGEMVQLQARTSLDTVRWYRIDRVLQSDGSYSETRVLLGNAKEISQSPPGNTVYEAEASFTGQSIRKRLTVYVKGGRSFVSGRNDGFTLGEVNFAVAKINGPRALCVGDDALFISSVTGPSAYHFQWKQIKEGSINNVGQDTVVLLLKNISVVSNGRYFCEITDLCSGDKRYTDTLDFTVYEVPDLTLAASAVKVAAGTEVTLSVGGASTYRWNTGDSDSVIQVTPLLTTTYEVKGYDVAVCPRDTAITVTVVRLDLEVGPDRYIVPGEMVQLQARTSLDTVRWYRIDRVLQPDGSYAETRVLLASAKEISQSPPGNTVYEAEASFTGQSIRKRLTVYVKGEGAYASGKNDGFTQSQIDFIIRRISYPSVICEGDDVQLRTAVIGPSTYVCQWKKQTATGTTLVGQDSVALDLKDIQLAQSGKYFCEVKDRISGQIGYTDTVEIQVKAYPQITIGSPQGEVLLCYGDSIWLDARDTEFDKDPEDVYKYSWSGNAILTRHDTMIVQVGPVLTSSYVLTVENAGCFSRDTVTVGVYRPLVDIPSQLLLSEGEYVNLQAKTDHQATLDWYLNGRDNWIQQGVATTPFRYGPVVQPSVIYVEMTYGGCKAVDSCEVLVKTGYAYGSGPNDGFAESCRKPVIVETMPTAITGCTADSVILSLWVEGTQLEYIWQKEIDYDFVDFAVAAGSNVSGLGSNELKFSPPLPNDEGMYRCLIRNGCGGEVVSDTFAVSVRGEPVFRTRLNQDWKDQCLGAQAAELAVGVVVVNSKKEMTYTWEKDHKLLEYTTAGITIPLDSKNREGWYKVTVSNECGSVSDSTYLPVYEPAIIKSRDTVVYACNGEDAVFVLEPGGGGDYQAALYEVRREASNPQQYTVLTPPVGTGLKVVLSQVDQTYNDKYYVWVLKNLCGADTSKLIRLRIENQPAIETVSPDVSLCAGNKLQLNCLASGSITPLQYEWFRNGVSTGQKKAGFVKTKVTVRDSGSYVCRVTNTSCGVPVESNPVKVEVHDRPGVSAAGIYAVADRPNSKGEYCQGSALQLKIEVMPPYEVDSIRWYKGNVALQDQAHRAGCTTTDLLLDSLTVADAGNYQVYLYNGCGVTKVGTYRLSVIQPATFVWDGNRLANLSVCQGNEQVLSVSATGTAPIRYTWTHNGEIVADGYSSSIHLKDVTVDTAGMYCCEIHNACDPPDGNYIQCAELNVIRPVEFELQGGGSYCVNEGSGISLTLAGSDTASVYRLYKNGQVLKTVQGKDYAGAPIVFENNLAGIYYVTALLGNCEFRMPGTIEIKENKAPVAYTLGFGKQYCTGTNGAVLQLSGSENNSDILYTLYRRNTDDTWTAVAAALPGNGNPLKWEQIKDGTYRVEAVNQITGCKRLMSGMLTVVERNLPEEYNLLARSDDSVYCAGTTSDVELYLSDREAGCRYTLVKDGTTLLAQGTSWQKVTTGEYMVEAVNSWGCQLRFGRQEVVEQSVPAVTLSGGAVFCEGDTVRQQIEIAGLDVNVDYVIYQKSPVREYGHLSGVSGTRLLEVPLEEKEYYVVATDRTPSACQTTSATVAVKKSTLDIQVPEEVVIANGETTRLTVNVSGQTGSYTTEWQPAGQIDGDYRQNTVVTKGLQAGLTFTVTVTDEGGCVLKGTVNVVVTGSELKVDIRKEDQLTSVDTIRLCANEKLTLYGWRDGGTGTYQTSWYDGSQQIAEAKDKVWLKDYTKVVSGYVYYQVSSGVITLRDSVYVDLLDTVGFPGWDLQARQCIADEDYVLTLAPMQSGALYTLEYDAAGTGAFIPVGTGVSGDIGSYDFVISQLRQVPGYYRIRAERTYEEQVCRTYSKTTELRVTPLRFTVSEDTEYCAGSREKDTIRLSGSESGVSYRLLRLPANSVLATQSGNGHPLQFTGNYRNGTYAVKATFGSCEAMMEDSVVIRVNEAPADKLVIGAGSYCEFDAGVPVSIGVKDAAVGATYTLYRRVNGVDEQLAVEGPLTLGGNLVFGEYSIPGEYYVVASQSGITCERILTGRVNIGQNPVAFEVSGGNTYVWGEPVPETVVKAYHTLKAGVHYHLYKVGEPTPVAALENYNQDTVYFRGALEQGYYVVRAEAGTCIWQSDDTVKIEALLRPYCINGDTLYCEGGAGTGVNIGIDSTQPGVKYVLQVKNKETGIFADIQPPVALTGSGYGDKFNGLFRKGDYRIVADNGTRQLMCGELRVRPQVSPDTVSISVTGNACADSVMTIEIATQTDVEYTLYHQGAVILNTLAGDGHSQQWVLNPAQKGTYRVKADNGKCPVILPEEIEVGTLPTIGLLNGDTVLCAHARGELKLSGYDPMAVNTLYTSGGEKAVTGTVVNGECVFKKVLPDTYYVEAAIGMCKVRSNLHRIRALPAAAFPAGMLVSHSACVENGEGWVKLEGLTADQVYILSSPSLPSDLHLTDGSSSITVSDLAWGEYCLRAMEPGNDCPSGDTCFTILETAPADSVLEPTVYCKGGYGTRLKLSGYTTGGVYTIYDENGDIRETLTAGTAFRNLYTEGRYLLKKQVQGVFDGCTDVDTLNVREVELPSSHLKPETDGTGVLCAGTEYRVGLRTTEQQVRYVLRFVEGGRVVELDTLEGDGEEQWFNRRISEAGYYRIYAQPVGTECGVYLDSTLRIQALPAGVDIFTCHLCGATTEGCGIRLEKMEGDTRYLLCEATGSVRDTLEGPGNKAFKPQGAGHYVVMAEGKYSGCRDTMGKAEIDVVPLPVSYTVLSACSEEAEVVTAGSELGVTYVLYRGDRVIVDTLDGTGSGLNFGRYQIPGIYKVWAVNAAGCGLWLPGSVTIYNRLQDCNLTQNGEYCGSGSTGISLTYGCSVPGWNYYLSKWPLYSDTLAGNLGALTWDKVNGNNLLPGTYRLYAYNNCKDTLLQTYLLLQNATPGEVVIVTPEVFCSNEGFTVEIAASEPLVEYRLVFVASSGKETLLGTGVGNGDRLQIGGLHTANGRYRLYGKYAGSSCEAVVAEKVFMAGARPVQRYLTGQDVCLNVADSLVLGISQKDPQVSYYLYRTDTEAVVDSLTSFDAVRDFRAQRGLACYAAYARHEQSGCRTDMQGVYCLNREPDVFRVDNPGPVVLCLGDTYRIRLLDSDPATKYQILRNGLPYGNPVTGTGDSLYVGEVSDAGVYRVKAANGCEAIMDDSVVVKVNPLPVVEKEKDFARYCEEGEGIAVKLQTTRSGVSYTLIRPDGTEVLTVQGTGSSMEFYPQQKQGGFYRIEAKDQHTGCVGVDSMEVYVDSLPEPFVLAAPEYLCVGGTTTITLAGSQKGVLYTLYLGDVRLSAKNGTGDVLSFPNIKSAGNYTIVGKNAWCERLMMNLLQIQQADTVKRFDFEGTKLFYCYTDTELGAAQLTASQPGVEYELYQDGQPTGRKQYGTGGALVWDHLAGKSCSQFEDGTDNEEEEGGVVYQVVGRDTLTNCLQTMKGKALIIEEKDAKVAWFHPNKDISICQDSSVDFTIIANGCNLTYTWWQKGPDGAERVLGSGRDPFWQIIHAQPTHFGTYWCEVTNSCSQVAYTSPVTVKVRQNMEMNPDRDVSVCDGKTKTVKLEGIFYGDTYNWYRADDPAQTSLSTKQVLTLENITAASAGAYVCEATNGCFTLVDTCVVRIGGKPSVELVKAKSDTLCRGSEYELVVHSSDSVIWRLNGQDLPGVTGNRLYIPAVDSTHEGHYSVRVIGGCDELLTDVADLYVDDTIRVDRITPSQTILCAGRHAELYIETTPSERVAYRWEYLGNVIGRTNHLTYGPLANSNTGYTFRVFFTNKCILQNAVYQPTNFRDVHLLVNEAADVQDPVPTVVVCAGEKSDTVLRVGHDEVLGMTYSWHYYSAKSDTVMLSSTADTVVVPLQTHRSGYYFCRVDNGCEVVATNACWLRVDSVPVILGHLEEDTICEGAGFSVQLPATGGSLNYEWHILYRNGQEETVAQHQQADYESTDELNLQNLSFVYDSARIWCHVTNHCDPAGSYSDTMLLRIRPYRNVTLSADTLKLCGNDTGRMVVTLEEGSIPWRYSYIGPEGVQIDREGLTAGTDTLKVVKAGIYRIISLTDGEGCVRTHDLPSFVVEQNVAPTLLFTGGGVYCAGETAVLKLEVKNGVGPFEINIAKVSGGLATEIIGGDSYPLMLTGRDTTLRFIPIETENYYIYGAIVDRQTGCQGVAPANRVGITVHPLSHIDFRTGWPTRLSQCLEYVNLREMLEPKLKGEEDSLGKFRVNGFALNGDIWLVKGLTAGGYDINYSYEDKNGCPVSSDQIRLTIDTLPAGRIISSSVACGSSAHYFRLQLSPVGRIDTVVIRQIRYKKWDPVLNPVVTPVYSQQGYGKNMIPASGLLEVPLRWDVVGGVDSCIVIEVLEIRDVQGCEAEFSPETMYDTTYRTTVWRHWPPEVSIRMRHSYDNNWKEGLNEISLVPGDSLAVEVSLLKGMPLWSLPDVGVKGITGIDTLLWLKEEGIYSFRAKDDTCGIFSIGWPELKVTWWDTGYFCGRLWLEGPFDMDNSRMFSSISSELGLPAASELSRKPAGLDVIDWIAVELRVGANRDSVALLSDTNCIITSDSCLLLSNGQLADRWTGDTIVGIRLATSGGLNNRYVVVRHRNHLGVMSNRLVHFVRKGENGPLDQIDFRVQSNVYCRDGRWRDHMTFVMGYGWMLSGGELNTNFLISLMDPNRLTLEDIDAATSGMKNYDADHDINFDGVVDWPGWSGSGTADWDIVKRNRRKFTEVKWLNR